MGRWRRCASSGARCERGLSLALLGPHFRQVLRLHSRITIDDDAILFRFAVSSLLHCRTTGYPTLTMSPTRSSDTRSPVATDAASEMLLLTQMIEEISGELALQPLLERIIERACRLLEADDGLISLYDADADLMRVAATYRIQAAHVPIGSEARRGEGLTGLVLERGTPVRCRYGDLAIPKNPAAFANEVLGMPIQANGRLIGVFSICAIPPRHLIDDAEHRLEQFARHAAIAIANARRYSEEQRRATRFVLIAKIAAMVASSPGLDPLLQHAADVIHEVLEYPAVDIALLDPDNAETLVVGIRGGEYKRKVLGNARIPVARSIMGAAVRERKPQVINDVSADPRYVLPPGVQMPLAEIAIPILHGGTVLGVLNVESAQAFDELDRISLEIVAEHLAVAIVNARLVERDMHYAVLEERQRLAQDLHDNVTQILSSIHLLSQSLAETWRRDRASGEQQIVRLAELSRMALAEMRELLQQLTPGEAPQSASFGDLSVAMVARTDGLIAALQKCLPALVLPGQSLDFDFDDYRPQAEPYEQALLRVSQEAVSNAVRHSSAQRIEVAARVTDDRVVLQVIDDGRGIPDSSCLGMGLSGMQQRLHELGGDLDVVVVPRGEFEASGTKIVATLPRCDRGDA
jgi:two-component system, NarL family, sensor kinase